VEQHSAERQPTITLSYKRASKRITTRLPVIAIDVGPGDMFWHDRSFEILLEAHDKAGNVVGEARPLPPVTVTRMELLLSHSSSFTHGLDRSSQVVTASIPSL
jgi:hypothetical protein